MGLKSYYVTWLPYIYREYIIFIKNLIKIYLKNLIYLIKIIFYLFIIIFIYYIGKKLYLCSSCIIIVEHFICIIKLT